MEASLVEKIEASNILVVGAGGIGCELLKNLAGSGFKHVEVIDLDTIDVSNLNRQFLFRTHHVGKPKCTVACEAARDMSPHSPHNDPVGFYVAHHGNVKDNDRFGVNFFKRFDVVLNALDNVDARRHVNRLCLSAEIPLIEAGTTGYLGQTTVIMGKQTECYECQPKPTQKVYPICTIRSTPSMPVHCIVWAKELYKLMFGSAPDSMLFEDEEGDEKSTFMSPVVDGRLKVEEKPSAEKLLKYTKSVLTALFTTEINKQLGMDRYKGAKKTPVAHDVEAMTKSIKAGDLKPPSETEGGEKRVWTNEECCQEIYCIVSEMYTVATSPPDIFSSSIAFDKDNHVAMRFVAAASNLRASVFKIETNSYYTAKGIAGNIIPAIATTNAIVAGQEVLELMKILKHGKDKVMEVCKFTYCLRAKTRKGFFLQPTSLQPPNEKCYVCKNARVVVSIDTKTFTLEGFIDQVLKKKMSFNSPILQIGCDQIYEDGEPEYEQNLAKTLENLPCGGIKDGTTLVVEDFEQDMEVNINFVQMEFEEEDERGQFLIGGDKPVAKKTTKDGGGGGGAGGDKMGEEEKKEEEAEEDDDDIEVLDANELPPPPPAVTKGKKRGREEDPLSSEKP
ncbi:hypothetical protein TrRE_jg9055 [Triparma retinervis]|uniref:SUMO-activating enzyme subunit n=1 Tax=Triparma retinervis TaxID=2557542 RepID=A0A9W6ZZ69_9STRA|nr:hypothetical protein TrRE_jg9055 [Triparma retinervis]